MAGALNSLRTSLPRKIRAMNTPRRGFTLFEVIVAMFIVLVGLLGIFSVFGVGVHARLVAQELVISQELAGMWADWIRFRLNDHSAAPAGVQANLGLLETRDLQAGKAGQFYEDRGDFHFAPGSTGNLPTCGRSAYRGYRWEIAEAVHGYKPEWSAENGARAVPWDQRLDGGVALPPALGEAPGDMVEVKLVIARGARRYSFYYVFSGVGIKYDHPYKP